MVSDAPANIWVRPSMVSGRYYTTLLPDEPDAVRYVRADLYEALMERMRSLDPLGSDIH
jgi:hypothetical protein